MKAGTAWRVAIAVLYFAGYGLGLWGIAELTTPWLWPIGLGVLFIAIAVVLTWTLASEVRREGGES